MSVGLGTLKAIDGMHIEVAASNYDADYLTLYADAVDCDCQIEMDLDRRQMQELSIIIDRFLDKP